MEEIILRLTLDFRVLFDAITQERLEEYYRPYEDSREVMQSEITWDSVARQNRLLSTLMKNKKAFNEFLTYLVVGEVVPGMDSTLKKLFEVKSEEEILEPVILALGGDDIKVFKRAIEEGTFYKPVAR
jgi:hypothetical protein